MNKKKSLKLKKTYKDNDCPNCGAEMKESIGTLSLPVNGEDIAVLNSTYLLCPKCKEIVLRLDETRKLRESAIERYRKKYHLLSSDEIRSFRERLGLTQAELAKLLRLGANTISRWEAGRNVQTQAMDILFRLIRDVPESIDYLHKLAA